MEAFDVIIIGAGPAGIFTALELSRHKGLKVLILEKGSDLAERIDEVKEYGNKVGYWSSPYNCGWGGAGAFSDGKLTLSTEVGGFLARYVGDDEAAKLIERADRQWIAFGAPVETYGDDQKKIREWQDRATRHDLRLLSTRIRHMGSDRCTKVLQNLREHLSDKITVRVRTPVKRILVNGKNIQGVETADGEIIEARYIVVAPGREGAGWFSSVTRELNLTQLRNPVDIGLRIEVPASVMNDLTSVCYEAKFIYYSPTFDDKVRTFCMCPAGEVIMESYDGIYTVNGHSYHNRQTANTNFAILVSTDFTEPFTEAIQYGHSIAHLANLLSKGVIVQRHGDLLAGRRSTATRIGRGLVKPTLKTAVPGDLSFVLPYRYLQNISEMLKALDNVVPGIHSRHTLMYGVEVKFYSQGVKLSGCLETEIKNLFAVGDGAGISRGLIQSSSSGLVVAVEILNREGHRGTVE